MTQETEFDRLLADKHISQAAFQHKTDWVFDLDNTIYPAASSLFPRVAERMTLFICEELGLNTEDAAALKTRLFRTYGTTMHGLMKEYNMTPDAFLAFVHEIDLSDVSEDAELDRLLGQLGGRKHIYTNGTVRHAERILEAFGIRQHFDHIFDIVASDHIPKPNPAPYDILLAQTGIQPEQAVMIEDMARNLEPAAKLGMGTIWLVSDHDWAHKGASEDYVHFIAEDVKHCLTALSNAG